MANETARSFHLSFNHCRIEYLLRASYGSGADGDKYREIHRVRGFIFDELVPRSVFKVGGFFDGSNVSGAVVLMFEL